MAGLLGKETWRRWLIVPILLAASPGVAGSNLHPLFRGDVDAYPKPSAVSRVAPSPSLSPDPRVAALFAQPAETRMAANKAVSVRVTGMAFQKDFAGFEAGDGEVYLVLDTEWTNIQARQEVARSSLEGKADRSMGAGSLTGGSAGGNSAMVLVDVGYKIPKLGDHVFALADGYALDLTAGSIAPDQPLSIPGHGETRSLRLAFRVEESARSLAFHFFDYRNGPVSLALTGGPAPAQAQPGPLSRLPRALELSAAVERTSDRAGDLEAPADWQFVSLALRGRSLARSGKIASILELHPQGEAWLEIDGGYLFAPTPAAGVNPAVLRFTPDFFQQREIVFLAPRNVSNSRLGLRLGDDVLGIDLGGQAPVAPPVAFSTYLDGDAMRVEVYALRSIDGAFVLDLGVAPLLEGKGLEIDTGKQFAALVAGQRLEYDPGLTSGLAFGVGETLVVPPGTAVRFELAFAANEQPAALVVRGFRGEAEVPLSGLPVAETNAARPTGSPLAGRLGSPPARFAPNTAAAAARAKPQKTPAKSESGKAEHVASEPAPPPVLLPPAHTVGLPREAEPNDKFEEATPVTGSLAVSGFLKQGDRDFITFTLEGQPQLWAIEASGAGLRSMSYHENSGQYTLNRNAPSKSQAPLSMTHLHLSPGRHTIGLIGKGEAESEYVLRMVPLGPPDPALEREPNDKEDQANLLPAGETRYGWLYDADDRDFYRFSLQSESRLRISVTPPAQYRVMAQVNRKVRFESAEPGKAAVHEGIFAAGDYELELKTRSAEQGNEPYALKVELLNPFGEDSGGAVAVEFAASPPVPAAFQPLAQQLSIPLRVQNRSADPQHISLSVRSSHWRWQPRISESELTLGPGESRETPVDVEIQADAWSDQAVQIAARATADQGQQGVAALQLQAACNAQPVSPRLDFPVPEALRGGFNLAWSALGAEPLGEDALRQADLYDGITPNDKAWSVGISDRDFPYELTVRLAGDGPAPLAGVLLNPQGSCKPEQLVKDFEVLLSSDGETFQTAASGTLTPVAAEQAWIFEQPVKASHARLRVLSNNGNNRGRLCLGEFKVIADPTDNPWREADLNIGLPRLGGHVVWSSPLIAQGHAEGLLSDESDHPAWKMDHLNSNVFVVGLHHGRAALLRELQWVPPVNNNGKRLTWMQVSASMESPIGPWIQLGRWELKEDPGQTSVFRLDNPAWARYLRFTNSEPEKPSSFPLPETLRIIEARHGDAYRSILTEWGHYLQPAFYEQQQGLKAHVQSTPAMGAASQEQAGEMAPGQAYSGKVSRGEREEWYRIKVPVADNSVEFTLEQGEADRLEIELLDGQQTIPFSRRLLPTGETIFSAAVKGGSGYLLRITEPERYIVIAWDNSGSVSPYKNLLYQSLGEFAQDVSAGIEYVNFIPFQEPPASLLSDQWLDQPGQLQTLLNDYDRGDSSSNAETSLLRAAGELGRRQGSRAIIVLTDAASHGYRDNARLWKELQEARPRIFSLELHSGQSAAVPRQQDIMQDLAGANDGHYSYFSSQADLDTGFKRASCMLRRPAGYVISMATRLVTPPAPGAIEVELAGMPTAGAVEFIFDASGSMWARLDGVPRIEIARKVLVDLVNNTLPDDANVALRVFGNREAQSCRTDLEIRPGPLDRAALVKFLEGIQPKDRSRTPLAESLRLVEKDLEKVEGAKLVILLTDGEESCDGDPDAAIEELREKGLDLRLNIVGLAIDDAALKTAFARWAASGGGQYFDTGSGEQLGAALRDAMLPKFQVIDASDTVIATGSAGGKAVDVPVGTYRVRVMTDPPLEVPNVEVRENTTARVSAGG